MEELGYSLRQLSDASCVSEWARSSARRNSSMLSSSSSRGTHHGESGQSQASLSIGIVSESVRRPQAPHRNCAPSAIS